MSEIKRLHYFNHQFLVEADFTDEQQYHLDMRRRHNRVLHTYGVADGLQVEKTGDKEVTVSPGTAVDREGREIVQTQDRVVDLSDAVAYPPGSDVYVTIEYAEEETDPSTATGVVGNTRVSERSIIEAVTSAPPGDGSVVRLAHFVLDGSGNVPGSIGDTFDDGVRQTAGAQIVAEAVDTGELADGAVTMDKLAPPVQSAINAPIVSLDGVSNPGGDVDLQAQNAITITPNNAANRITIGENHSTRTNNPHGVTTAQVGALASVDGVSSPGGNIDLQAQNAITIAPSDAANRITIGENHSTRTNNPHGVTAAQVGALPTTGGSVSGDLSIGGKISAGGPGNAVATFMQDTAGTDIHAGLIGGYGFGGIGFGPRSALVGYSTSSEAYGVFAHAPSGTHALYVSGTSRFTGAKTGYVVDTFVNASGQTLRTGDIVTLKGTPITRFQGDDNKIPVVEVTLADKENDPAVIGIVDREAIPDADEPDTRTTPEDPTSIPDGGELFVVTLGTYAHCKVDATEASIEAGDLLTTSSNPGHAKRATDPKIGTIIGKALEPLAEGTGYIAVFVNIQ